MEPGAPRPPGGGGGGGGESLRGGGGLDPLVEGALAGALAGCRARGGAPAGAGGEVWVRTKVMLGRHPPDVALAALDRLRALGWPRAEDGDAARAALALSQALRAVSEGPVLDMDVRRRMARSREEALRRKAQTEARREASLLGGTTLEPVLGAEAEAGPGSGQEQGGSDGSKWSLLEEGQGWQEDMEEENAEVLSPQQQPGKTQVSIPEAMGLGPGKVPGAGNQRDCSSGQKRGSQGGCSQGRGSQGRSSQGRGSQGWGSQGPSAADAGGPEECPGVFNEGCPGRLQRKFTAPPSWFFCSQCQYVWVQETVESGDILMPLELDEDPAFFTIGREASCSGAGRSADVRRTVESYLAARGFLCVPGNEQGMRYHLGDYKNVLAALKEWRGPGKLALGEIPANTLWNLGQLERRAVPRDAVDLIFQKVPGELRRSLMPYQVEGVKFGISRNGRVLLGDEMGLGKSIQAIALSSCYKSEGPLLVVCPASVRLVWAEELERWLPGLRPKDIHVIFNSGTALPKKCEADDVPAVTITSYNMLSNLRKRMEKIKWGFVIADESHVIRCTDINPAAGTSVIVSSTVAVLKKAKRLALLSGTPSLNRPFDLFLQVDALWPKLLGDLKRFAARYCNLTRVPGRGNRSCLLLGGKRLKELHILLRNTVMIRRMKDAVLAQLPPKRRQVIRLALERTTEGRGGGRAGTEDDSLSNPVGQPGPLAQYHRVGLLKLKEVCALIRLVLHQKQKTIVFGHHHDVMDKIEVEIAHDLERKSKEENGAGSSFIRIDGRTDAEERQALANKFQNDPSCRLALLSIRAAGLGMNFSAAKCVIFAEIPRTVADLEQAEARAHRHGVKSAVNIYFAVARDPSDEEIWRNLGVATDRLCAVHNGRETDDGVVYQEYVEARPMSQFRPGEIRMPTQAAVPERPSTRSLPPAATNASQEPSHGPAAGKAEGSFWFELSPHTGRVHAYTGPEGSEHSGVTCLSEALLAADPRDLAGLPGVFSTANCFTEALAFLREWLALRPLDQRRLQNRPLQCPLSRAVAEIPQGETRLTTNRNVSIGELRVAQLPPGAVFHGGTLTIEGLRKEFRLEQPRLPSGVWLCVLCMEPLPGYMQGAEHLEVRNKAELFCSEPCYEKYAACSSAKMARKQLFALEKGVCQECGLDCEDVCRRLQVYHRKTVDSGTQAEVMERRTALLKERAPIFFERGYKTVRERLLNNPSAGNAWQADHILPVFRGGGMLGIQNLRTLCTICHLKVTKKQATWRKNKRKTLGLLSPTSRGGKASKRPPRHGSRGAKKARTGLKYLSTQESDERRLSLLEPMNPPSPLSSLSC